jgi:5'-3' exonuclease
MTLVDMMNIIFIEFHITRKKLYDEGKVLDKENFPFLLHNFFNKLNYIISNSGKLIICWEGSDSLNFRRSIFPDYKRNRDKNKGEEEFQLLFNNLDLIKEGLKNYPVKQIFHQKAEADDVIFALSKEYGNMEDITIISSDKDLVQIMNYFDKISVWDPIKKRLQKKNKNILIEKAIIGDASDNIGGLYRIGPKTLDKMLEDKNKWNDVMSKSNNKDIFESLLKIIDLRKFPDNIHKEILDKEKNTDYNEFKPDNIELFYWENRLPDLINRWQNVKEDIRRVL